jgi:RNA polymerase sigma-70 factor (sigma-E family)
MEPPGAETLERDAAARTEDAPEIHRLYRDQAIRCGRLAFLLTEDNDQAQELVQEAFTRLVARWRSIKDPVAIEAYLRRTVVNLAQKSWRKRNSERAFVRAPWRAHDVVMTLPDVETREQLRVALRALPFRQRAVIVLRYYEDLSERDIADALGCARGTVKSSLSRGLDALRIRLEGEQDE